MMAMDSQTLVKLGPSIPESLGNFRLDDHNVVEWSDSEIPGVRHKARKETGKWINPVNNADIQYQKQEDCKKSERGQEQTRTEVIHGQAPDSEFQIVRSHSHYTGSDPDKFNSRVQSSSTSYQMSSSNGVRSTSKSTSNRTTTKTVTVSGGRSDDFENLGLTYQPLDNSTQRERINVSRSGTMGVRRPPTRRHTPVTPAPIVSTSPDDSEVEIKDEIIVDSDDNLRNSPPPRSTMNRGFNNTHHHSSGLSIVEFKDITPKFRGVMVGFPVEIQLELQSKLRGGLHHMDRNGIDDDFGIQHHGIKDKVYQSTETHSRETDNQRGKFEGDSSSRLFGSSQMEKDSTFDFHNRKKSYELESFDSHAESKPLRTFNSNNYASNYLNLFPPSDDRDENMKSQLDQRSPSPISPSWDFFSKTKSNSTQHSDRKLFDNSLSSNSVNPFRSPYNENNAIENSTEIPIQIEGRSLNVYSRRNFGDNFEQETDKFFGQDNYIVNSAQLNSSSKPRSRSPVATTTDMESPGYYTPDGGTSSSPPTSLPTSLERSRRLLQMLDETPSILHNKETKNFSNLDSEECTWNEEKEEQDWQTQRQLSFLNDSLSRILETGRTNDNCINRSTSPGSMNEMTQEKYSNLEENIYNSSFSNHEFEDTEIDINGNLRLKPIQVSQTWISSGDLNKPSQKVRDKDVTTSISATHDHFRRGAKKVEFCKTEVHFTADSGKFHIVETDENKPSTSHLFRRKKKDRSKHLLETDTADKLEIAETTEGTPLLPKNEETRSKLEKKHWHFANQDADKIDLARPIAELFIPNTTSVDKFNRGDQPDRMQTDTIYSSPFYDRLKSDSSETQILDFQPIIKSRLNPEDAESPSQTLLSNYEEMKIQRYLNHLKSPSSVASSPKQIFNFDLDHSQLGGHRFNNVLYENGSFVPLATRRSLIEMNNNKKADGRELTESDNRSSYSITPDNSSKPIRLARMEARVATDRPNPQITSVELRYEFDNDRGEVDSHMRHRPETPESLPSYHPLTVKKKLSERPSSFNKSDVYSSRSERISDLIKRSYYKNPDLDWTPSGEDSNNRLNKSNDLTMSAATISSTSNNKSASKSIVTIGDYESHRSNLVNQNNEPSPEPVLSMDHTWKGPAYDSNVQSGKSSPRSFTLLKLNHSEPEWISKARNREHRIKDWESVGRQHTYSTPSQQEQPPWMDDFIRPRIKTAPAEQKMPKVSVVYPWQRHTRKESKSRSEAEEEEQTSHHSHIVSIIPTPSVMSLKHGQNSITMSNDHAPKSLPVLSVLELSKQDIEDRDSDSIVVHSTHLMKNKGGTKSTRAERSLPDPPSNSTLSKTSSHKLITGTIDNHSTRGGHNKSLGTGTHSTSKNKGDHATTNTNTKSDSTSVTTRTSLNTVKESVRGRARTDLKSVPPSVDSRDRMSLGGSSGNKRTTMGKDSPSSNSTPIHRHPLVKVSKLPVRRNLPPKSSADGKTKGSKIGSKENPDESEKSLAKKTQFNGPRGGLFSTTNVDVTKSSCNNKSDSNSQQQPWRRK